MNEEFIKNQEYVSWKLEIIMAAGNPTFLSSKFFVNSNKPLFFVFISYNSKTIFNFLLNSQKKDTTQLL